MHALANLPKMKIGPEGTWTIATGKTIDNRSYSGTAQIHPMGKIYTVAWLTTLGDYSGLAFFEDDYLFAGGSMEQGYGIALYKINQDGTLDGKWVTSSSRGLVDWERAVNGTPGKLEGSYEISGFSTKSGRNYQGKLDIRQLGETYQVTWLGKTEYQGIGLRMGDWLFACWGEGKTYSHAYKIQGNRAQGYWAYGEQSATGEEVLERIC